MFLETEATWKCSSLSHPIDYKNSKQYTHMGEGDGLTLYTVARHSLVASSLTDSPIKIRKALNIVFWLEKEHLSLWLQIYCFIHIGLMKNRISSGYGAGLKSFEPLL